MKYKTPNQELSKSKENNSHKNTQNIVRIFWSKTRKTPTPVENPRKGKLSLKENLLNFSNNTEIISLPTINDKFTQAKTNNKIPQFMFQHPVVRPHTCVVHKFTFIPRDCKDCTFNN